jgi:hypothetical protein
MNFTFDQVWKIGAILFAAGGLYYQAHADHLLLLEQKTAIQHLSNQVIALQVVVERIDPIKIPFEGLDSKP